MKEVKYEQTNHIALSFREPFLIENLNKENLSNMSSTLIWPNSTIMESINAFRNDEAVDNKKLCTPELASQDVWAKKSRNRTFNKQRLHIFGKCFIIWILREKSAEN